MGDLDSFAVRFLIAAGLIVAAAFAITGIWLDGHGSLGTGDFALACSTYISWLVRVPAKSR